MLNKNRNPHKDDVLGIRELEAINKIRKRYKLDDMTLFALLLIREGQDALKTQDYERAKKLTRYAVVLAPNFPLSYYAQGYLYMYQNWTAVNDYFVYYVTGITKSIKHYPTLFMKIYKNILIMLFCFVLFYFIITFFISFQYLPVYLTEITERYKKSIGGILKSLFMIFLLFVPFIFQFSIMWIFLYFPVILWPYLKSKEKILILFLLLTLICMQPFIMHSFQIVSHKDFKEYDFPSVLIYHTTHLHENAARKKKKRALPGLFTLEARAQKKIAGDIWTEIKTTAENQNVKALLLRPIAKHNSHSIFNPFIFILWILLMVFFRIRPQIGQCGICRGSVKNLIKSNVEKKLICNNCYLLFNHGLEIKLTKKRKIEENLKIQHDFWRILSYCVPGFIQFSEKQEISKLCALLILYFLSISFYIKLRTSLAGQFLVFTTWQVVLIMYIPIIAGLYLFLLSKDREIINDKAKKLETIITR
ncbi:MAG: tetratricopeptide repeat protein [bacterium]